MKTGIFLPTTNNGYIFSTSSPQFMPTFALNRQICRDAEGLGYEFAMSMVKYRGYGDGVGFWDYGVESTAVMAALTEATTTLKLWASVGVPSTHPAMIARTAATLDDATGGRFGINVVPGWNKAEYAQMGLWPGDQYYTERYDYCAEYISVLRGLWRSGRLTHHGRYFDLDDCLVQPRPEHDIPIIVPGQSDNSLRLAAAHADISFLGGDLAMLRDARSRLAAACGATGRSVSAGVFLGVIAAETDEEAVEQATDYMRTIDLVAAEGLQRSANVNTTTDADPQGPSRSTAESLRGRAQVEVSPIEFPDSRLAAFVSGSCFFVPYLVGSYDRVAAYIRAIEEDCGIDHLMLVVADYTTDVRRFGEEVMPRLAAVAAR